MSDDQQASWTMFDEINYWLLKLEKLREFAIEMDSHEQDSAFLDKHIHRLIDEFAAEIPDDDGYRARYTVTLDDDRSQASLVISLSAHLKARRE